MDKADVVFSQYIRLRDRCCKRCGSQVLFNSKGLPITHQASHFQVRRKEATRFNELNVDTMCANCHPWLENHPAEHRQWQINNKGLSVVEAIIRQSNTYHKKDRQSEYQRWSIKVKELLAV